MFQIKGKHCHNRQNKTQECNAYKRHVNYKGTNWVSDKVKKNIKH